jgi:hypothetical protein
MDRLDRHAERLLDLKSDRERQLYFEQHSELRCDEGARVLCRSAVALLYSNIDGARIMCPALTSLSQIQGDELSAGYCDLAWAALHFSSGSDFQKAPKLDECRRSQAAKRDEEATITRCSSLPTLVHVGRLDLFWEWEGQARLVSSKTGTPARERGFAACLERRMEAGRKRLRTGFRRLHRRRCSCL